MGCEFQTINRTVKIRRMNLNGLKIATVEGYWSTNIGNSLFQLSAQEILKDLGAEVIVVPDLPGYINVNKGNPSNYFEFMDVVDCDAFCVHGPFFRKETNKILLPLLKRLQKRGVRLVGLGVGAMHYDSKAVSAYQEWFEEVNFDLLITRDDNTYRFLKERVGIKNLWSGIDLGFFISRVKPQPAFKDKEKLVCLNFDQIPEPRFLPSADGAIEIGSTNFEHRKVLSSEPLGIGKKLLPFLSPYFYTNDFDKLGGYRVIRLDHRYNPYWQKKIYGSAAGFGFDTPAGYLLAYANSVMTLSNRVHANVATLSYGNPAMYFSNSKRAALLDRVELGDIYTQPMVVNQAIIDDELGLLKERLVSTF